MEKRPFPTSSPITPGFWLELGYFLLTIIVADILTPKPKFEDARPDTLGDLQIITNTEGRPVPILFGRALVRGANVLWYGDFKSKRIRKKVKTGLVSSKRVTVGYRYFLSAQWGVCRGPGVVPVRVWYDDRDLSDLITISQTGPTTWSWFLDEKKFFGGKKKGGGFDGAFTFHNGDIDQPADTWLYVSAGGRTAPQDEQFYQGTCYIVMGSLSQGVPYIGNSAALRQLQIEVERYPNQLGMTGGQERIGNSANPMCMLFEILTSTEYDIQFQVGEIDQAGMQAVGTTLFNEGNGMSLVVDSGRPAVDLIAEIERQVDGLLRYNPVTNLIEFVLARQDYTAGALPLFNETNMVQMIAFSRPNWSETINQVRVEFPNPDNEWQLTYAMAEDTGNQSIVNARIARTLRYPGCTNAQLAANLAARDLRSMAIPRSKIKIKVNADGYDLLLGDVIAVSYDILNLSVLPMRIIKIEHGNFDDPNITIDAVEDVFDVQPAAYLPPPPTLWIPPSNELADYAPGNAFVIEAPRLVLLPYTEDDAQPKLMVGALAQNEVATEYELFWDQPSGGVRANYNQEDNDFFDDGFVTVGSLAAALPALQGGDPSNDTAGNYTFTVNPVDDLSELITGTDGFSSSDYGRGDGLIVLDPGGPTEEFIIVGEVLDGGGGSVILQNCFRGALDSAINDHPLGTTVWFIWDGGLNFTENQIGTNADTGAFVIQSAGGELFDINLATEIVLPNNFRHRFYRPILPTNLTIEGTLNPTTVDADTILPVAAVEGIEFQVQRRDWRELDFIDHMAEITTNLAADGYDINWFLYDLETTPTPVLRTDQFLSGSTGGAGTWEVTRTDIVNNTVTGRVPDDILIEIETQHVRSNVGAPAGAPDPILSRQVLLFSFPVTSVLS